MTATRNITPLPASLGFTATPSIARLPVGWIALACAWAAICAVALIFQGVLT